MPEIVLMLFTIIILQACIRMGFVKWYYMLIYIITVGLINFFAYPFIVNQGNTYVAGLFGNKVLINNLVLLLVTECILFLRAGFIRINNYLNPADKSEKWFRKLIATYWGFPGFSFLLATFYFQHLFLLWVSNINYDTAAILYVGVVIGMLFLAIISIRYLLLHQLLQLESALILTAIEIIILLTLLNLQTPSVRTIETPLPILPLLSFMAIAFFLALTGYYFNRKNNKINK